MEKKETQDFVFKKIYPKMRYMMSLGRKSYNLLMKIRSIFSKRPTESSCLPKRYKVCNTTTINSQMTLNCIEGNYPSDIDGALFLCQCLGDPEAFMVGDTNIVRMDFESDKTTLTNRLFWNPAAMARLKLKETTHRFDFFGLMYLSPGLGMFSYTEGMYLLPDGRIAVTSDVDRPWVIERDSLKAVTPIGKREEWLPMISGNAGEVMGGLFSGYSNSHVVYTDHDKGEAFMVSYQCKQADGSHPVKLIRWDGYHDFESWMVVDHQDAQIEIQQSIHELVFTRDYILLADTAFVAGTEMLTPWINAPLPYEKTVLYIIDRRELVANQDTVRAKRVEIDEPCIHLIPEYDNPKDLITLYMLHTPATNTAEILHSYDRDLQGNLFPFNTIGYGTLPVLDLSSLGKHRIDAEYGKVLNSEYLAETPYCWGPYLYTYMGRQIEPFNEQDLFIMFKGFSKDMLPKRIYKAYKDVKNRRVSLEEMTQGDGIAHNNSICRIEKEGFSIADAYIFPDKVLLYTIACLDSSDDKGKGYVLAGIVTDNPGSLGSSGHEYWLFDAKNLEQGPICKLGHKSLNNSTLFHTVYIPKNKAELFDQKEISYHIPLRDDYPKEELLKWDPSVLKCFEETIWPYFDKDNEKLDQKNSSENLQMEEALVQLSSRRISTYYGKEDLIGEEKITDAPVFAKAMIDEANRMWQTTGWKIESNRKGLLIESKQVSGTFEDSGVLVTRCVGEIDVPAQVLFDLLVSPEGYAIIDPISKPEDHEKPPLEVYQWKEGCRLEAALASAKIPMMGISDFVVLNAIDPFERIFVSKSILHDSQPGGSKYSNQRAPANGHTRSLNTFAIKMEEISKDRCRVLCINYMDLSGKSGAKMNNFFNTKGFFGPLYKRMIKAAKN